MVKLVLGILALSLTALVGLAEEMTVATPDAIKWGPAPPVFAKGMQFAVIYGDPAQTLNAGAFLSMPAKMDHYAWASSATVIQHHGVGPLALTYVNPADDPRLEQPHDNR
jgi:hypothetical protein